MLTKPRESLAFSAFTVAAAAVLSCFVAPASASAQLPYEDTGQVECGDRLWAPLKAEDPLTARRTCVTRLGDRKARIWSDLNKDAYGVVQGYRVAADHVDPGAPGYDHVNLDRCTRASIADCDRDLLSWQTVVSGRWDMPSVPSVNDTPGIYRACGAPSSEIPGQKWLCTAAISVHQHSFSPADRN